MIHNSMTIPSQDIDSTLKAWLGGIIDGEGSFAFWKMKNRRDCHLFGIYIVNTDKGILNQITDIYTKLGVPSKMNVKKLSNTAFANAKPCWEIIIRRRDDIKIILKATLPYIFSYKKDKALKMLEYMELHPKYTRTSHTN
jgi:hypothetical protein